MPDPALGVDIDAVGRIGTMSCSRRAYARVAPHETQTTLSKKSGFAHTRQENARIEVRRQERGSGG
jgi:hypothetical protein